ncbi:hypothetical protein [Paraburkholderia youngii]|uniref:hypothetical protein n=1 Tax=Paraburkholderia youngii TaxID=2782701 RepID=UPI003D1D0446
MSKLLAAMTREGIPVTMYTLGDRLATYVPQWFAQADGTRSEEHRERWTEVIRPAIFHALSEHYIDRRHTAVAGLPMSPAGSD